VDLEQSLRRIPEIRGAGDRGRGHLIAQRRVALAARRHRHGRDERLLRKLAPRLEIAAHRRAREREQYVVHLHVEVILDLLHGRERYGDPSEGTLWAERRVEAHPRHACHGGHLRLDQIGEHHTQLTRHLEAVAEQAERSAQDALEPALREEKYSRITPCRRMWRPMRNEPRRRFRLRIEEQLGEPRPRCTVHDRVVGLEKERDATPFESLDEPHLPERLPPVEMLGVELAHHVCELPETTRRGDRDAMDVPLDFEIRIVDEVGAVEIERNGAELLREPRHRAETLIGDLDEACVTERRRVRPIENGEAADVRVDRIGLHGEEESVAAG